MGRPLKRLDGWKEIAAELSRLWRREVPPWKARRFAQWRINRLPVDGPRYSRASITAAALKRWARVNKNNRQTVVERPMPSAQTELDLVLESLPPGKSVHG